MNPKLRIINHLRDYRIAFDMTQEELAERAGVSRQSIISIENERSVPNLFHAIKISEIFYSRVDEIFILRVRS